WVESLLEVDGKPARIEAWCKKEKPNPLRGENWANGTEPGRTVSASPIPPSLPADAPGQGVRGHRARLGDLRPLKSGDTSAWSESRSARESSAGIPGFLPLEGTRTRRCVGKCGGTRGHP